MGTTVAVLGIDPGLANMGLVEAEVCLLTGEVIKISRMTLIRTEKSKDKQVKRRNDDMHRARLLTNGLSDSASRCLLGMAEIPGGAQSARAAYALGVAVGVLAGCPIPLIEVDPQQVKKEVTGKKTASKQEMIEWATAKFPDADWIRQRERITDANEHLADALAIIFTGITTPEFKAWSAIAASVRGSMGSGK